MDFRQLRIDLEVFTQANSSVNFGKTRTCPARRIRSTARQKRKSGSRGLTELVVFPERQVLQIRKFIAAEKRPEVDASFGSAPPSLLSESQARSYRSRIAMCACRSNNRPGRTGILSFENPANRERSVAKNECCRTIQDDGGVLELSRRCRNLVVVRTAGVEFVQKVEEKVWVHPGRLGRYARRRRPASAFHSSRRSGR